MSGVHSMLEMKWFKIRSQNPLAPKVDLSFPLCSLAPFAASDTEFLFYSLHCLFHEDIIGVLS